MSDSPLVGKSESVDDFLKAVYRLQQSMERVSTNALRDELNITAPSVTDMAQRLVNAGLIDYQKYRGVVLTDAGEHMALKIIRRHRLIETFLLQELEYTLQEVHEEAERLEHAVSDRFIEALAGKLGDPQADPHGDPIPSAEGTINRRDLLPLTEWPLNEKAAVRRIMSQSAEMLQHILDRGFTLDALVEVLARDPFDGPVTVRLNDESRIIGHNVAACILVESVS